MSAAEAHLRNLRIHVMSLERELDFCDRFPFVPNCMKSWRRLKVDFYREEIRRLSLLIRVEAARKAQAKAQADFEGGGI